MQGQAPRGSCHLYSSPRGQPLALTCFLFYLPLCCWDKTPTTKSNLGDSGLFALLRLPLKTLALPQGPGWVFLLGVSAAAGRELVAEPCSGCPTLSSPPPAHPHVWFIQVRWLQSLTVNPGQHYFTQWPTVSDLPAPSNVFSVSL